MSNIYREYGARRNPLAERARALMAHARKIGDIKAEPCEKCGATTRIHAHHDDYTKPYEVRWFCAQHHGELHKQYRKLGVKIPGQRPLRQRLLQQPFKPPKPLKPRKRSSRLTITEFARMGGYAKARATSAEDKRLSGQKGAAVRWANQRAREQQARETLARDIDAQLAAMGDVKSLDDIEL